jgi:hypothetical protein
VDGAVEDEGFGGVQVDGIASARNYVCSTHIVSVM